MPYSAEISRHQPGCMLFLIDQSASMNLPFGSSEQGTRAERLTGVINRLLQELVLRCTKSQDEGVLPYFDVGVFGYGSESFGPVLNGALAGRPLVSIREVAEHPLRLDRETRVVEDGRGGVVETEVRYPVWFELDAIGKTPMCGALRAAHDILAPWVAVHDRSLPPLVFNVTDGEATDGDPREAAVALRGLATRDGHVLLFNVHITSSAEAPIRYPASDEGLADAFARQLFEMSSVLPARFREKIDGEGSPVEAQARAFIFKAGLRDVVHCLDIGTRLRMRR